MSDVAEVEAGALQKMKENPELAVKHPGLLRSIKSATGIQEVDDRPQNVVNVDSLQMVVKQTFARRKEKVQDAEVIEPTKIEDSGS